MQAYSPPYPLFVQKTEEKTITENISVEMRNGVGLLFTKIDWF